MHVHTETTLSPDEVLARFASLGRDRAGGLVVAAHRRPPKLYRPAWPGTLPAAAEVAVDGHARGAEVVLRLMWGPLPAPFPRALVGAGALLGALVLALSGGLPGAWLAAGLLAGLPAAALLVQRRGERDLQRRLGELLGGVRFRPRPH